MLSIVAAFRWMVSFCALEIAVLRARSMRPPRFTEYVSSLFCGLLDLLVNTSAFVTFVSVYALIVQRFAPIALPVNAFTWVLAVLAHDLAYYAFHRASHQSAILWAAHEVHHQSDDYSLSVSLRQGTIATWVSWVFYAPLALVGVSVEQFVAVHIAHQVFQFFVHTRLVPKLGPLEWLLATPSHHRVHHGRDEEQIDRNYGGFLIVWDRLFGTFTTETEEPRYGVPEGIQSWSPFWANVDPYRRLLAKVRAQSSAREMIRALFGPPTTDRDVSSARPDYDAAPERDVRMYSVAQATAVTIVATIVLSPQSGLSAWVSAALIAWLLLSMASVSRMLDDRPQWRPLEIARVVATGIAAIVAAVAGWVSVVAAGLWIAACALSLYELAREKADVDPLDV
ncbi:MAG: sterol desaturase family protein [Polyangiales bacterium]